MILVVLVVLPAAAQSFRSDSKRFGNPKMDIVLTETERLARTSIVEIQIKTIGSSVGSSFFLLCSIRDLARQRGNYRYRQSGRTAPPQPDAGRFSLQFG